MSICQQQVSHGAAAREVLFVVLRCERYVGTEGGGMDQAVSVMAQQGLALHVEFEPVSGLPWWQSSCYSGAGAAQPWVDC